MNNTQSDLLIIGAGLTGLSLAYKLRNSGLKINVIEARSRIGGRILTIEKEGNPTLEMGATWLMPVDRMLLALIKELGLNVFEQRMNEYAIYDMGGIERPQRVALPKQQMPSYRIKGGSSQLIKALAHQLSAQTAVWLNEKVEAIRKEEETIFVQTNKESYHTKFLISTLPPYLLQKEVFWRTRLPEALEKQMQNTHTWMRDSIKFGITYATPFWREKGRTGIIFSNAGPIIECFDHSDAKDQYYALKGFLHPNYQRFTKEERCQSILQQLENYYGQVANNYLQYEDLDWSKETFTTSSKIKGLVPHQNNGHVVYQESYWEGRLLVAGTETAQYRAGYMEGALQSADFIVQKLEKSFLK